MAIDNQHISDSYDPGLASLDSPPMSPFNVSDVSSVERTDSISEGARSLSMSVTTEGVQQKTFEDLTDTLMSKIEALNQLKGDSLFDPVPAKTINTVTVPSHINVSPKIKSLRAPADASNAFKYLVQRTVFTDDRIALALSVPTAEIESWSDNKLQQELNSKGIGSIVQWKKPAQNNAMGKEKKASYTTNRPGPNSAKRPIPTIRKVTLNCLPFDEGSYTRLKDYALVHEDSNQEGKTTGASPKVVALVENILHYTPNQMPTEAEMSDGRNDWQLINRFWGGDLHRGLKHFIFCGNSPAFGTQLVRDALLCAGFEDCFPEQPKESNVMAVEQRYVRPKKPFNGFMVLPSSSNDELLSKMVADDDTSVFNDPENAFGKNCRIVIADSRYTQGISLFDVRVVHLFDMVSSINMQRQAIARAIRNCGHRQLTGPNQPNNQWYVDILKYASADPAGEFVLTEGQLFEEAMTESIQFDKYLNALRKAAIDYGFYNYHDGYNPLELPLT